MTTATKAALSVVRKAKKPRTFVGLLREVLQPIAAAEGRIVWPSPKYREDPVAFAEEILGLTLWPRQIEILRAAAIHKRIAIKSGHKVSKSHTLAILALWFYCSFDDARVVMSSVTSRQVDEILWRELKKMVARSKAPIDGKLLELARSGLKSGAPDFREIVGFTAKEAEGVAGVSGANLLYLLDEASGIADAIFEAIEGNRAGGARVIMTSNPTQTTGEFFEAFESKKEFYHRITISSEESPNVVEGREVFPGLAGREWIEEKRREWGSFDADGKFHPGPLYFVRVLGMFVMNEQGHVLSLHVIHQAEARWADADDSGTLNIGIDPAGPGQGGDESAFAMRRNLKITELTARRGLTAEGHLVELLGIIATNKRDRDPPPIVKLDIEGPIGWDVYSVLRAYLEQPATANAFVLVPVRSSGKARASLIYDRIRDELFANLLAWFRDGGSIPEDTKLAKELHAPKWLDKSIAGDRLKVTPKSELRKLLERSPDRADAVQLAVWEPAVFHVSDDSDKRAKAKDYTETNTVMDPYEIDGMGGGDTAGDGVYSYREAA